VVDLAVFFAFFFAVTAIDRTPDFSLQTIYCFRLNLIQFEVRLPKPISTAP
jgi:hypothetical protein